MNTPIEQKLEELAKIWADGAQEEEVFKLHVSDFAIEVLRSARLERHDDQKETCCVRVHDNINALIASLGGDKV
jgi:hypothetical protein